MRAIPITLNVDNLVDFNSNNEGYEVEEVIKLENAPSTVYFGELGNGRVSPKPYHGLNVVDNANSRLKQRRIKTSRQRGMKIALAISCILSVTALILVCALIFGYIEPKNFQRSNTSLYQSEKLLGK